MFDLLSSNEDLIAAEQGWGLYHVYEMEQSKWTIRILPADTAQHVINRAKLGDSLALKALRTLMHGGQAKA